MEGQSSGQQWPQDATSGLAEMRGALTSMLTALEGEVAKQSSSLQRFAETLDEKDKVLLRREHRVSANEEKHLCLTESYGLQHEEVLALRAKLATTEGAMRRSTSTLRLRTEECGMLFEEKQCWQQRFTEYRKGAEDNIASLSAANADLKNALEASRREHRSVREDLESKLESQLTKTEQLQAALLRANKRRKDMESRMRKAEAAAESVIKALGQIKRTASALEASPVLSQSQEEVPLNVTDHTPSPPEPSSRSLRYNSDAEPRKRRRLSFPAKAKEPKTGAPAPTAEAARAGVSNFLLERVDGGLFRDLHFGTTVSSSAPCL